jgi:hypothetical protein
MQATPDASALLWHSVAAGALLAALVQCGGNLNTNLFSLADKRFCSWHLPHEYSAIGLARAEKRIYINNGSLRGVQANPEQCNSNSNSNGNSII